MFETESKGKVQEERSPPHKVPTMCSILSEFLEVMCHVAGYVELSASHPESRLDPSHSDCTLSCGVTEA